MNVEPTMWASSARWTIEIQNALNADTYVTFVLEKGIVPTLFSTVPFLLFLSGGSQIAWWIVLRPIRDRTKSASLAVMAGLDESERVYDGTQANMESPTMAASAQYPEPDSETFNIPTGRATSLPKPAADPILVA